MIGTKASNRFISGRWVSLPDTFSVTLRHRNTVQVPFRILVQAADADLAYALTFQDASKA
jgi:hypothetical protein